MPARVSRTISLGRPRMPDSCSWPTCSHWVAIEIEGEHRLVLDLEAVELLSRHVLVREHRTNSGHRPRAGRVDGKNPGVGVRAPHRRTPKHSLGMKIG